jgi:hypothetical protein
MPFVDRDQAGNIVGIYANAQRPDHEWVESATLWVPSKPLQQRIDELVHTQTQGQIQNELMLEGLMAGLLGGAIATGLTEPQLESRNSAYRNGKLLRAAIAAMRAAG